MEISSPNSPATPPQTGLDVSSRAAFDAMRASENRYRRLFETARDGILVLDAATRKITDANPFMAHLSGLPGADLTGKHLWEIGLLPDAQADENAFQTLREKGVLTVETRLQNARSGEFFDLEIVANAYIEGDALAGHSLVQCSVRDVSERRRGAAAQSLLASVVASSSDAIFSIDLNGLISSWNRGAAQLYGYSEAQAHGLPLARLFAPAQARQIELMLQNVWRGNVLRDLEAVPVRQNAKAAMANRVAAEGAAAKGAADVANEHGKRRRFPSRDDDFAHVSLTISPLYDDGGELRGATVVARDISEQKRAHQASGRREKLYRALTANFPNGAVYLLDLDGRFFLAEGRGMTQLGFTSKDFLGKTIEEMFSRDPVHARLHEVFLGALQGSEAVAEVHINGRFRTLRSVPVRDERGKIAFILVMTQDVTQRKQAELALAESEMRMRALVESLDEVVFEFDAEGTYLNVWTSDESLLARPKSALIGRHIGEVVDAATTPLFLDALSRVFAGGAAEIFEYQLEVEAEIRWFTARLSPILGADGGVKSVCTLVRDITGNRRVSEALAQTNREIVTIWESMSDAFYALDNNWKVTRMNAQAAVLLQRTAQELVGKNIWEEFPDAVGLRFYHEFQRAMREQVPLIFEEFYEPLGMWSETRVYPSAVGLSVYFSDITRRKRDEQALRASEARFHSIVSNVPGMVYQFVLHGDGSFEFPFISEGCRDLAGLEPEAVRQNPLLLVEILDPADQAEYARTVAQSAATLRPWVWEGRGRLTSGRTKWVQGVARPRQMPDGSTLWDGLLVDISARKEAEEERDRFFTLSPDLLGIAGRDGYFKRVNPAFEAVLGYAAAEITARPSLEFVHPDDREMTLRHMDAVGSNSGTTHFINRYICRDGETKWLSWHVVPYEELFYVAAHDITPLVEAENALRRANEELEERVNRRTAQLAAAQEEEAAARREAESANRAKSEFLSRMSHELRTPLNAIVGFSQILQSSALSPAQNEQTGQILQGGWHLLGLINEILDISRVEAGHLELELEAVSLATLSMEVCALVRPLAAQRNVRLDENALFHDNCWVMADRQRLKQVLINLLSNAIKYNRRGGRVEVWAEVPDEATAEATDEATDGPLATNRIRLGVRDTGMGISASDQAKLFVPFERLHAADSEIEGTGLGLVLSRRLMTAMDGGLEVESEVGQGSTFWLELPRATAPLQVASHPLNAARRTAHQLLGRTYTVLCIEDNLSNLRLLEAILENRPEITLMAAAQGQSGLHLAREHPFDLILLDLNLPDIDGAQVLAELQALEKTREIPVIVVSADATPPQIERLLAGGARAYLTKPLDVMDFLATLDETLLAAPPIATPPIAAPISSPVAASTSSTSPAARGAVNWAQPVAAPLSLAAAIKNTDFLEISLAAVPLSASEPGESAPLSPPGPLQNSALVPTRSLRILVAEDNLVNQKVVRHQLENLGHQPTICDDGYALIQAWQSGDFDLILMDCHMPKLDGYATTREIRHLEAQRAASPESADFEALPDESAKSETARSGFEARTGLAGRARRIPIIALTANALSGDRKKSLASGMNDHLGKPINQSDLAAALNHWSQVAAPPARESKIERGAAQFAPPIPAGVSPGAPKDSAKTATDSATSDSATSDSALQPERWRELQSELDADLLGELAQLFLAEVPQLIAELQTATGKRNVRDAYEIAHKLKGSCATMGAARLSEQCRALEAAAQTQNWEVATALLQQLPATFGATRRELEAYLDGEPEVDSASGSR